MTAVEVRQPDSNGVVREVARYCWGRGPRYRAETTRGSHPTKGVVIDIALFVSLLANGIPGGH